MPNDCPLDELELDAIGHISPEGLAALAELLIDFDEQNHRAPAAPTADGDQPTGHQEI